MFRLNVGPNGEPVATQVNPIWSLRNREAVVRVAEVLDTLKDDGYLDDVACKALTYADANEFLAIIGDLDLARAQDVSSFIQGVAKAVGVVKAVGARIKKKRRKGRDCCKAQVAKW